MGGGRIDYGHTVIDGKLQYISPSSAMVADPSSEGCFRKYWYQAIKGIRAPQTRAQTRGTNLHAEIEDYMRTGNRSLSSLALSGLHMVPDPGPGLGIELPIAGPSLATAPLRAAGIPVVGYIDLVHNRGTNKGGSSIEDAIDPPGTVEVLDWKSTSSPQWIKTAKDMARTLQMTAYGKWALTVEPAIQHVRLSHGYFVERGGASRKVSLRVLPEFIDHNWEHFEGVARIMIDVVAEPDPDRVPANTSVCDRFGGCPAKEVCKARMHMALSAFVGQTAADKLLGRNQEGAPAPGEFSIMGLMDRLQQAGAAAPPPTAPVVTTTPTETSIGLNLTGLVGAAPTGPTAEQIAAERAERAKLDAEEKAQRAAAQVRHMRAKLDAEEMEQRAAAQFRHMVDRFTPLLVSLEGYAATNTFGFPTFIGDAAKCYCSIKGKPMAAAVEGNGPLAGQKLGTLAELEAAIAQLTTAAAAGQIKPPASAGPAPLAMLGGLLSPETPASSPTPPPSAPAPTPVPVVPPAAVPAATSSPVVAVAGVTTPSPEEKKPDKPKAEKKPKPPAATGTTFSLFVDCASEGIADLQSFHPILDAIAAEVAALGGDTDLRAAGVRATTDGKLVFAKDDSPNSFGRWEGVLTSLLREKPFAPGNYYLFTRGNRIAEVAAEALRAQCRNSGGVFVMGNR